MISPLRGSLPWKPAAGTATAISNTAPATRSCSGRKPADSRTPCWTGSDARRPCRYPCGHGAAASTYRMRWPWWSTRHGGRSASSHDALRESLRFRAHFPSHECLYRRPDRCAFMHDPVDFPAYGHVHRQPPRNLVDRACRGKAFDHLMDAARRVAYGLAPAQGHAEAAIAGLIVGAGEHQVAEPCQAHECLARGAELDPQAHHFGKTTGDQRHAGVGTETHAVGDPRADRNDILDRTSNLHTHDVGLRVGTEIRSRQAQRKFLGKALVA